jgi:hypothetical protein
MKKKIFLFASIAIVVFIAFVGYKILTTKTHSPQAKANFEHDGVKLDIVYCRPYKKGRLIFGSKDEGALQPYGNYWRIGANEATTFETNKTLIIDGKELKTGKYQIYAVPQEENWNICWNTEWDRWGAQEANHETDEVMVTVPVNNESSFEEQLRLSFTPPDSIGGTSLVIHWDKTEVLVPITIKH